MGRICKMSKSSVKSFIDSIDRKTSNVFNRELTSLNDCKNDVEVVCRNFTNWAYSFISENEYLIADALDCCNQKKNRVQQLQASTPAVVKREQIQIEKVKNSDGSVTEKKVTRIVEEPNPQFDINKKNIDFLNEQQQQLRNLSEACKEHRRSVDLIVERVWLFLAQISDVEEVVNKCQDFMNEHAKQLTVQAGAAYQSLASAMKGASTFSAMHDNDGYVDITGVHNYCCNLQFKLEDIEEKLNSLRKTSAELKHSWNDRVYEHFNCSVVNTELPKRLSHALFKIKLMKADLEEMCAALNIYYGSEASIQYDEIYFSYEYIGIDKEVYNSFRKNFTI